MREEHAASVGLAASAHSPGRRACHLAGLLLVLCAGAPLQAATYSGTVFEDANFGGGVGRSRLASGGVGVAGARVEIFRVNDDQYLGATTTSGSGAWTLSTSGGDAAVAVRIRVVNATVRSNRPGGAGCTTCVPVQTFRTNVANGSNAVSGVIDRVGGENPALSDATAGANNNDWDDLPVAGARTPQSFTTITPANGTANISGIDFGFSFSLVVNTRDAANCTVANSSGPCQGSLRQFIINANALGGEGALSQLGNGLIDNNAQSLPSGFESSIFMISEGLANPGQPASFPNQLTGGVAVITLAADLPAITDNIRLDATTQTVNIGNTNAGVNLGSGGSVGVDGIPLPTFPRPEVQLTAGNRILTFSGNNSGILGFALRQGYILLTGSNCLVRHNLVGMTATGDSNDNSTLTHGITFTGPNATVRNNFVTINNSGIRTDNGGANSLITLNEVARPASGHGATYDGILLVGTVSGITVSANLTRDQAGGGIEVGFGGGATASLITVTNNTVSGNGFTTVGGSTASTEPLGMAAYAYTGNSVVFSRNIVRDNGGAGIMLMSVSGTQVTQNHFSNNRGPSIDLDTRTVDPNTLNTIQGVTLNDAGDADAGPNGLRNYPVMVNAVLAGGELSLGGFARPGAAIELYIAEAVTSFGEGLTYLGTLTEGSAADLDAGTGTYGPGNINGLAQGTDTTNRFSFRVPVPGGVALGTRLTSTATLGGETSEFGGNVLVTAGPSLQLAKTVQSFSDPVNGTTNPKSFPGATKTYVVTVSNQGAGAVDSNSVIVSDPIPANTRLFVGNLGAPGSGPVAFVNGSPSSALTWTYSGLGNTADDLEFSNDGGTTWTYVPVPDAQGCDAAVTHIRMRPKGVMPGNGSGNPSFQLQFRVLVN